MKMGATSSQAIKLAANWEIHERCRAAEARGEILWHSFPLGEKNLSVLIASSWPWTVDLSKSLINQYGKLKGGQTALHKITDLRQRGYMEDYHPTPLGYLMLSKFAADRACFPKDFQGQLREPSTPGVPCSSQDNPIVEPEQAVAQTPSSVKWIFLDDESEHGEGRQQEE